MVAVAGTAAGSTMASTGTATRLAPKPIVAWTDDPATTAARAMR
jgi:hypothetical protein